MHVYNYIIIMLIGMVCFNQSFVISKTPHTIHCKNWKVTVHQKVVKCLPQ